MQAPPLRISFFVSRLPSSLLSPAYLFHYFFLHNEPSGDCNWSDPMVLKRKAHTKSRTGCGACKRRRIKVWPISYANICSATNNSRCNTTLSYTSERSFRGQHTMLRNENHPLIFAQGHVPVAPLDNSHEPFDTTSHGNSQPPLAGCFPRNRI